MPPLDSCRKYTSDEFVTSKISVALLKILICELLEDGLTDTEIVFVSTLESGISKIAFGFSPSFCVKE